jgi:2',3'-cyclic-nucleotide 2'-phosphodiesterase (5'-nucleotidase family)
VSYHYSEKKEILLVVGRVQITDKFKPDPAIVKHVTKYSADLAKKLDNVCAFTSVDLECRFSHLRTQETNSANMLADIIYTEYK